MDCLGDEPDKLLIVECKIRCSSSFLEPTVRYKKTQEVRPECCRRRQKKGVVGCL